MSLKRSIGLDWFELTIHVGITVMLIIIGSTATVPNGHGEIPVAGIAALSMGLLAWRRSRALSRMGPDTGEIHFDRLQELESRVAELEHQQGRVLELEERLDFAERLLTQQREASRQLGSPGQEV